MRRGLSASSGRGTGEGIGALLRIVHFSTLRAGGDRPIPRSGLELRTLSGGDRVHAPHWS